MCVGGGRGRSWLLSNYPMQATACSAYMQPPPPKLEATFLQAHTFSHSASSSPRLPSAYALALPRSQQALMEKVTRPGCSRKGGQDGRKGKNLGGRQAQVAEGTSPRFPLPTSHTSNELLILPCPPHPPLAAGPVLSKLPASPTSHCPPKSPWQPEPLCSWMGR